MNLTDEGPRDADVVVLLHGWPGGVHTWRHLAPLLATRFRVITAALTGPDLRAQASDVASSLRDLGIERFAAVGHGHGGGVAQILAAGDHGLDALVLIDSIAFADAPPAGLDPRTFVERGSVEIDDLSPEDLDVYTSTNEPVPSPIDLSAEAAAMAAWTFPVFLLWGEEDPYLPVALAERITDSCPGATLGVVPDSGHFLLDDAFDPVGVMMLEYLRARFQGAPHGHEGVVMLQLERRPPWVGPASFDTDIDDDDDEPAAPGPDQEVGRHV